MQSDPDHKLEAVIDAELKQLPRVPAPVRLAPQVLAILAARAQAPWWQRSWWDWPLSAKAAFILTSLAIVAAFSGGGFAFGTEFTNYSQLASDRLTVSEGLLGSLIPLGNAAWLLWDKCQPVFLYALALAGVLYVACLGLGTACLRSALKQN